jgi:4-amino-4-deoxy-L-arabinose transferase-like glycosyltransferase/membrane-associated phospholipid phosphatase
VDWLRTLDTDIFRFVKDGLSNPFFDVLMPFLSYNNVFFPLLAVLAAWLIWKGKERGLVCVLFICLVTAVGDGQIIRPLKLLIERPRPMFGLEEALAQGGSTTSYGMPSAHAANWFSAAMVAFMFYRRSIWFMLPLALAVSFSRIYNGAHYPSDVLVGAILGAGYGAGAVWGLDALWRWVGQRFFPLWWQRFPSLLQPRLEPVPEDDEPDYPRTRGSQTPRHATPDMHWLRLGYVAIGFLLLLRWIYISSDTIELSEDEAYQWLWSKYPALSYFSKPPMIALTHMLGTALWGDTVFGVRFFSPLIAALLSVLVLRFFAREVNARAGFVLLLTITTALLMSAGSILMTVDPLSVLFWVASMLAGWQALKPGSGARAWAWAGLWLGLGFLSKYTALFQLLCWAVFFTLHPPARKHLRTSGPWVALLVLGLCSVPVLIWNAQHAWITVAHVADNAGANKTYTPTLKYVAEFLGGEFALLNPIFFVATVWACAAFWRRQRHQPLMVFLFCMGAPVFLIYLLLSFRSRVLHNWIAPSVIPLFALMVIYWDTRWRLGNARRLGAWLLAGILLGSGMVAVGLDTNLIRKATGRDLAARLDPLRRVRGWSETGRLVEIHRRGLEAEGKPVFIIANHYGVAGQLTFTIPEFRQEAGHKQTVYCTTSPVARNQFFFWPGYTNRIGENAVFVNELGSAGIPKPAPAVIQSQFESVEDWGVVTVRYRNKPIRRLHIFACRNLR